MDFALCKIYNFDHILPEEECGENWGKFLRSPCRKMSCKFLNLAMMVNEKIPFVNNLVRFHTNLPWPKLTQKENICRMQNLSTILHFDQIYITGEDNKNLF